MFSQFFNFDPQYRKTDRNGMNEMKTSFYPASERAYIVKDIEPQGVGRVRYHATDWNACANVKDPIPAGTEVIPIVRRGNTWLVVPVDHD